MEREETSLHILLEYSGVVNYRTKYLEVPRSFPEVFNIPRKLLRFLEELGIRYTQNRYLDVELKTPAYYTIP